MRNYREAMERCPLPEGMKERLESSVLQTCGSRRAGRTIRPWSLARRVLAAAILLALLTASVGAAVMIDWDQAFTDRLGGNAAASPVAGGLFQNVEASEVCGDVTLTVRQALRDEQTVYLLVDYQLPKSADADAVAAAWKQKGSGCVKLRSGLFGFGLYTGVTAEWREAAPLLEDTSPLIGGERVRGLLEERQREAGKKTEGRGGPGLGFYEVTGFDPETRTLRLLFTFGPGDWSAPEEPLTLLVDVPVLEEWLELADHPAFVTFYAVRAAQGRTGGRMADRTAWSVELSPLSFSVKAEGMRSDLNRTYLQREKFVLIYQDGREEPLEDLGGELLYGESERQPEGRYGAFCETVFHTLLDPGQVRAVRWGKWEIPLDEQP